MMTFFSWLKVCKYHLHAAHYVGRKDYDQAIQIIAKSLVGSKQDVWSLEMIALCHHWAKRDDLAIETVKRALAYDQTSFGAIELISKIFASRSDHDNAAHYMRVGLDNFQEPLPRIPRFYFSLLRFLGVLFPRFKRLSKQAEKDLVNPDQSREEWNAWAKEYLTWYDETYTRDKRG
ncbi:hypothetical protein L0244_04675 [bacterium]|nr:hypothetical protein [bacterium]